MDERCFSSFIIFEMLAVGFPLVSETLCHEYALWGQAGFKRVDLSL